MDQASDTYRTLKKPSNEIIFKEKKSKFYGYAFPIQSEEEVKPILEALKSKHTSVNHVCYAWQLGVHDISYRANDDGEPNNSAGMPIYGQIQSFEVTNILVAVARVFGGTKLGVGGLISAYKTAAQMALEQAKIIQQTVQVQFQLHFAYSEMDKVMRFIKQQKLTIVDQEMHLNCSLVVSVRQRDAKTVAQGFEAFYGVQLITLG